MFNLQLLKETHDLSKVQPLDFDFLAKFLKY